MSSNRARCRRPRRRCQRDARATLAVAQQVAHRWRAGGAQVARRWRSLPRGSPGTPAAQCVETHRPGLTDRPPA
eukprot:8217249-Pyramimonas_sp.AAC.1